MTGPRNPINFNLDLGDDIRFQSSDAAKQSQNASKSTQNVRNSGSGPTKNPGKQPPGQEQNGQVFRYPYSAFQPGQDMLKISIFEYEKNSGFNLDGIIGGAITATDDVTPATRGPDGTVEVPNVPITRVDLTSLNIKNFSENFNSLGGETKGKLKKNARHIFLPIPQQISDNISVGYSQDTLSPLDAAGVSAARDVISGNAGNRAKQIMNIMNNVRLNPSSLKFSGLDPAAETALKTGLATQVVNLAGRNISPDALISRASGQILQSNLELLFSGVKLRSFPFVFDFTPRDELEAEEVKKIIKTIKFAMSPSNGGTAEKGGLLLSAPDLFSFQYMSGKNKHPFLNSFKIGVLTDMKVNYTASGTYATYSGVLKSPVHMRMQLSFTEINPVYKEDYIGATDMPGVGF